MRRLATLLPLCAAWYAFDPAAPARAQGPGEDRSRQLADDSRARAAGVVVTVTDGDRATRAAVLPGPVMKYTDAPRQIELATLWVWEVDGCPVALGKVEAYRREDGTKWLYCFASVVDGLVEATWPGGRVFRAAKPGVEWAALEGPAPQDTPAGRARQLKDLSRRFAVTTRTGAAETPDDLRPLARPLHEYAAPKAGVAHGALFGFAANGTNPDVVVALEAVGGPGRPAGWRYGVVGMTTAGISVRLDKAEVFNRPRVNTPGDRDTWTHFWDGEPKK